MFQKYFINTIKNHFVDFTGRARRSEFWYFQLFGFLIQLALYVLIGISFYLGSSPLMMIFYGLTLFFGIGIILPSLSLSVRRLHDTGKSGFYLLLGFIPLVGAIVLLVFFCKEGDYHENQYGLNPKTGQEQIETV